MKKPVKSTKHKPKPKPKAPSKPKAKPKDLMLIIADLQKLYEEVHRGGAAVGEADLSQLIEKLKAANG